MYGPIVGAFGLFRFLTKPQKWPPFAGGRHDFRIRMTSARQLVQLDLMPDPINPIAALDPLIRVRGSSISPSHYTERRRYAGPARLLAVGSSPPAATAATKTIQIISDPPGARIEVNDDYVGDAPISITVQTDRAKFTKVTIIRATLLQPGSDSAD